MWEKKIKQQCSMSSENSKKYSARLPRRLNGRMRGPPSTASPVVGISPKGREETKKENDETRKEGKTGRRGRLYREPVPP